MAVFSIDDVDRRAKISSMITTIIGTPSSAVIDMHYRLLSFDSFPYSRIIWLCHRFRPVLIRLFYQNDQPLNRRWMKGTAYIDCFAQHLS